MRTFIISGDLHANKNTPRYRLDDYWLTWQNKIQFIIDLANKEKAQPIFTGDIFDTSRVYADVINVVMDLFKKFDRTPLVVSGQHDLRFHTDFKKSPLYALHSSEYAHCVNGYIKDPHSRLTFCGVSFDQKIPKEEADILIIHKCITPKKPPFFLHDAVSAKKFLKKHKQFKIILTGDYHVPHSLETKSRALINVGTIIRNKRDMQDHTPVVWKLVMDSHKIKSIEPIEIPHKPFDEVFDIDAIAYDKEKGIVLDVTKLKHLIDKKTDDIKFDDIIWILYKKMGDKSKISKKQIKEFL